MKEKIRETKKLILFKEEKGGKTAFFRLHKEDPQKEYIKIYEVADNGITYYLNSENIKEIIFKEFKELPPLVNNFGYGFENKAINSFFRFKLKDKITQIIIVDGKKSKAGKGNLTFNISGLESLATSINQEQFACDRTKEILIGNYISETFPTLSFSVRETNNNKNLILRNLNSKLVEKLSAEEVEQIGKFYVEAAQKFERPDLVKRVLLGLQKNAQILTLQEIVKKYEKLLKDNPAESKWQSFFNEYITLFDNRYVSRIDYKNIATGLTKYPDLVLADIYGYIDFYELKKAGTPLLQYDTSHKTFYWSKDISMAIAQASDYLQKSKENGVSYAATIKTETETDDEKGLDVNIINPRAIIVAGTREQLNTDKKRHHFKNLRESLKDIEFVLYDEVLERLKNLLSVVQSN